MKITYDTVSDSMSCPDLTPEQNRALQSELSAALMRNDPVQTVAARIMAASKQHSRPDLHTPHGRRALTLALGHAESRS